jgi:hypothetical protein
MQFSGILQIIISFPPAFLVLLTVLIDIHANKIGIVKLHVLTFGSDFKLFGFKNCQVISSLLMLGN